MSINTYQLLKAVGQNDARVIKMLGCIDSQSFDADQVIWPKGDHQQPFTYILQGLVCACTPAPEGGLNPVNIFGPGTWFGETSFLSRQASGFDYISLTPVRLLSIPYADALEAFEQEAAFPRYIAQLTSWRDQQHSDMLMLMRTGTRRIAWGRYFPCSRSFSVNGG